MAQPPNIVFLLNDHQAYYRHGWDSGPAVLRPNFDRLASGGVAFERAYTAGPLCGPARRSMLTGLFPHNHRELENDVNHPYDREVYLDTLAAAGYRNYYYGKWHAGAGTAKDHQAEGFSLPSYNNPYTSPEFKEYLERRGLPTPEILIEHSFWDDPKIREGETLLQDGAWCNEHASGIMTTPREGHEAFFLASLACERLRDIAASGDGQPWSLRLDFWAPHQPYFPTREFADMYDPTAIPEYGNFHDTLETKPEVYRTERNAAIGRDGRIVLPSLLPWSVWQEVLARSYAQTTLVDAAGGMVLDTLDELGLAEDTLVIWTTDHGDAVACHGGHFDKSSYMPEEMVRIPMAMRLPGRIPAGQTSDALVSNLDLPPTFLDAAGTAFAEEVDGASLLPLASGESDEWRDEVVSESHGHGEPVVGRLIVAGSLKYVANRGQMDELYDLEADPYELTNLIDDPTRAADLAGMRARLKAWQERTGDPECVD